jgi:hypothetical protein
MDRHLKNRSIHDRLVKRVVDQNWAYYEEEDDEEEYIWQEGQWCLGGLTRSQKRRVQHLRSRELEQAQKFGKPQVWHAKQTANKVNHRLIFKWLLFCCQSSGLQQIKKYIQILMNQSMKRW